MTLNDVTEPPVGDDVDVDVGVGVGDVTHPRSRNFGEKIFILKFFMVA
jgi:hypothetical protein